MPKDVIARTIDTVVRADYGKMLAVLIHQFKDIELAEDSLQEAISTALQTWDKKLPHNPIGWLILTAKRKAIDRIRRDQNFEKKRSLFSHSEINDIDEFEEQAIPDERLRLIFTCCHPALPEHAQIALTLKTLCGLSTTQISHAFLVQEKTISQRLTRAKNKIKLAAIPYEIPDPEHWQQRLSAVMSVIYLIFNEGYHSISAKTQIQIDLCDQAMHLCKTLTQLSGNDADAIGLLALMHFHYARFPARINAAGEAVSLREQDRDLWQRQYVVSADKLLKAALMKGKPGSYQIQAAISGVHSHAVSFEQTDWQQISMLYQKLYEYQPSPLVELNAAVALSFAINPQAGLSALETLEQHPLFKHYQPWYAAKADMLNRTGNHTAAKSHYQKAIELTENRADKAYLRRQMELLST